MELAGFIFSILGFALALLQSWSQLKAFSAKVATEAGTYAVKRLEAVNNRADFYIDFPSALISVYVRNIIALAAFWMTRSMLIESAKAHGVYDSFLPIVFKFALAFLFGKVVADSFVISTQIIRRAQERYFSSKREG